MNRCKNCNMELTGNHSYCTSYCEEKRTGMIIEHSYPKLTKQPIPPEATVPPEKRKIAVIEQKPTITGTIRNYDPTKAKWLNFGKYKSIAPPSFHERLMSIFESELKQYI